MSNSRRRKREKHDGESGGARADVDLSGTGLEDLGSVRTVEHTAVVRLGGPQPGSLAAERLAAHAGGDPVTAVGDLPAERTQITAPQRQPQPQQQQQAGPANPAASASRNALVNMLNQAPVAIADPLEELLPSSGGAPKLQSNTGLRIFQVLTTLLLLAAATALAYRAFFWDPYRH